MKYTTEITALIVKLYNEGKSVAEIAEALGSDEMLRTYLALELTADLPEGLPAAAVPERSIIAKLSSVGVYKKKEYRTKRGDVPIKKEEYIDRLAALLDVNSDLLESLEKVNKSVLALLESRLKIAREEAE